MHACVLWISFSSGNVVVNVRPITFEEGNDPTPAGNGAFPVELQHT